MFNLSKHNSENICDILRNELGVLGIERAETGEYRLELGDEHVLAKDLVECKDYLNSAAQELKKHLWDKWDDLLHLSRVLYEQPGGNEGGLANLLFLNNVKKAYLLSSVFSDLKPITLAVKGLFYLDASNLNSELIEKFNMLYLQIRLAHYLVMNEIYRGKVIDKYLQITKVAISGPWANLDLPMKERVWEWDEGEDEYFAGRTKARQNQIRYNPETDAHGFYFVWNDLTRNPYRYEDRESDSPYKSRHLLSVP